jgi:glycosyltransferase involved in cell wall biosynthesis
MTRDRRYCILINAIHARAGGGLTYLHNLLPLLAAEEDFELHLIPHPDQKDAYAGLSPAIRVHDVTVPKGWLSLLLWEQLVLPFIAWRIGFDVVFSPANFAPLLLPVQVIVVQNAVTVGRHERRIGKKVYWVTLRLMTMLSLWIVRGAIAVSQYVADTVATPACRAPITVIHHGINPVFSPAPPTSSSDLFILAVADLYMQKNLDRLIDAFVLVRRRCPALALRIAGAEIDREYATILRSRIATLGLSDAVVFIGRRTTSELVELYRCCTVFVFPSLIESFGMPLLEAMACGAPTLASNTSAIPEIAGGAALLFDPINPRDIADKILQVLDDARLRQSLVEHSLIRAREFSWPDCAGRTATVLRDAVSGRTRRAAPTPLR